jgi:hypothetical protein
MRLEQRSLKVKYKVININNFLSIHIWLNFKYFIKVLANMPVHCDGRNKLSNIHGDRELK